MTQDEFLSVARDLLRTQERQREQIACLSGFLGTLLGALRTKEMLHPEEIETLVEVLEEIAPRSLERPMQAILNTLRVTAEETPSLMTVDLSRPLEERLVRHGVAAAGWAGPLREAAEG